MIVFADEDFEVGGHTVSFRFIKRGGCLTGRAQSGWSERSLPIPVLESRRLRSPIRRRGHLPVREPIGPRNQFHRWRKSASIRAVPDKRNRWAENRDIGKARAARV